MKTLQQFKDALKAILEKQEKQDDLVNKALCMEDLLQKAGKPANVGDVRTWRNGFKYKKMADGKWRRVYDQDERTKSADNAAKRIMREIDRATDAKELWQVVSRHRGRFSKKDGTPLPIAIELRKYMADREQEVWAGIKSGKTVEARNRSAVLKNRRAMRAFPEAAIGPNLPTSEKLARLEKEKLTKKRANPKIGKKGASDDGKGNEAGVSAGIQEVRQGNGNGGKTNGGDAISQGGTGHNKLGTMQPRGGHGGEPGKSGDSGGIGEGQDRERGQRDGRRHIPSDARVETEAEKHENRSRAMMGNQNAKKDGIQDENDFNAKYNSTFDAEEVALWKLVDKGAIDPSKVDADLLAYAKNSGKFIEDGGKIIPVTLFISGNVIEKLANLDKNDKDFATKKALLEKALPPKKKIEDIEFSPIEGLLKEYEDGEHLLNEFRYWGRRANRRGYNRTKNMAGYCWFLHR